MEVSDMAMMNPQLAALLGNGQTAPSSVAGSPVVVALKKMMGAGGSAPVPQQNDGSTQAPGGGSASAIDMLDRQHNEDDRVDMSTEDELAAAQRNMGVRDKQGNIPTPRPNEVRQMANDDAGRPDLPFQGNRRSGPTSRDRAIREEMPTDGISEDYEQRFGRRRP